MDEAKDITKLPNNARRDRVQPKPRAENSEAIQMELPLPYAGEDEGPYWTLVERE